MHKNMNVYVHIFYLQSICTYTIIQIVQKDIRTGKEGKHMYSKETLKKVMDQAKAKKTEYMKKKAEEIQICISKGNRKIGRVMNVSLMPIMTCTNCKESNIIAMISKLAFSTPITYLMQECGTRF